MYKLFFRFIVFVFFTASLLHMNGASIAYTSTAKSSEYRTFQDPEPTKVPPVDKEKFLKKFIGAFKIRKNRIARDNKLIETIVNRLSLKDTAFFRRLAASKTFGDSLHGKDTTFYSDLRSRITALSEQIEKINVLKTNMQEPQAEIEIDDLVNKIFPILKQQMADEEMVAGKEKQFDRLKQIRHLLADGDKTDTLKLNDSTYKVYTLTLKQRAQLFGYHRVWTKDCSANYKFKLISTLAFYAYEVDGKTGDAKNMHGWDTSRAITAAQKNGCHVVLVVACKGAENVAAFLKNKKSQQKMITSVMAALKKRNANGVNVMFENMTEDTRNRFVYFADLLSRSLLAEDPLYELSITLPANDKRSAYDVDALNPLVKNFVIDFTKKEGMGPIAPLSGSDNSIKESLDRYLNQNIAAGKIIACLPYHGLLGDEASEAEPKYLSYAKIKTDFPDTEPAYDKQSATASIDDIIGDNGNLEKLWYDDDVTLNEKYDYILQNDIKGLGVWSLGYDNGHEELWNVMMDKLYAVDTVHVKLVHLNPPRLTLWDRIKYEAGFYKLMLTKPCDVDLDKYKGDELISYVMWFCIILFALSAIFYIYKLKYEGDSWKWKKAVLRLLIVLAVLVFISVFLYFFLRKDFSIIGITKADCKPVSFVTLITVITIGFAFGLVVMKFLVMPLVNKNERP